MSNFTIINDVTLEIRRRLFNALNNAPGLTLGLTNESSNISLSPPSETFDNNVRMSLYLYHMDINASLRNQRMLPQPGNDDEQRLPPLPLELHYLITPVDDEENNQLIIGRLMQTIYDNPSFSDINNVPLDNSFGGGTGQVRITPNLLNVEQMSQLWNSFNQPYRLAIALRVDVISVDSAKMPRVAPRVNDVFTLAGAKERNA